MGLTFLPRPLPQPRKRSRAAADIDGEHSCMQKKKRRLRLFLITSRLSPQFSHPATNIVDRGSSKIAVWARQKSLGRNLLRKAAILNRIRRRGASAKEIDEGHGHVLIEQEREQEELAMAKLEFNQGSVDTYTRPVVLKTKSLPSPGTDRPGKRFVVPRSPSILPTSSRSPSPTPSPPPQKGAAEPSTLEYCSPNQAYAHSPPRPHLTKRDYLPLPPSPLGLSNYDAFDLDDDIPNPYSHLDDSEDEPSTHLFDSDDSDDDPDSVPFSPLAATSIAQTPNPRLQTMYSDFNILNHSDPVFGDYDGIDQGAHAIWPSTFAKEQTQSTTPATSPDFTSLFTPPIPPKRADSFATSPNFRPTILSDTTHPPLPLPLPASASPNFRPTYPSSLPSPSLPPSPNLHPASTSPNFTHAPPSPLSPNFFAVDAVGRRRLSMPSAPRARGGARRGSDIEQEQERQRDVIFTRFGE